MRPNNLPGGREPRSWHSLPPELAEAVLEKVDVPLEDALELRRVSRDWRRLIDEASPWMGSRLATAVAPAVGSLSCRSYRHVLNAAERQPLVRRWLATTKTLHIEDLQGAEPQRLAALVALTPQLTHLRVHLCIDQRSPPPPVVNASMLGPLSRLQSLSLEQIPPLDNAGVEHLCQALTGLSSLCLGLHPSMGAAGWRAIGKLPSLRTLFVYRGLIGNPQVGDHPLQPVDGSCLTGLRGLTQLTLNAPQTADAVIALTGLQSLAIHLGETGVDLRRLTNLTVLKLQPHLRRERDGPQVSLPATLRLLESEVYHPAHSMEALNGLSALQELSLYEPEAPARAGSYVDSLQALTLGGFSTDETWRWVAQLQRLTRLNYADAPGAVSDIGMLRGLSNLQELAFGGSRRRGSIPSLFCSLTNLTSLSLHNSRIDAPWILKALPSLTLLTRLQSLTLRHVPPSSQGSLYPLASLTGLTALTLQGWEVEGVLAQLARLPRLRDLFLVGSAPLQAELAQLRDLTALDKLCLWDMPQIQLSDCRHLAAAPRLKTLVLSDASAAGGQYLRQRRPPFRVIISNST